MKSPLISIIIINYNTPDLVYNCLLSIKKFIYVSKEIIIVENGSKVETRVEKDKLNNILHPNEFKLLISDKNMGFGNGNNFGAWRACGKYLWFLNSDTLLIDDSAEKMVDFFEKNPKIGALSPLLYHQDSTLQKNFFASFQTLGSITLRRYNDHKIDFSKKFFYTDIVVGAAMMVKKETFDAIGGFDKNIFMYLEDDDLCKRLRNTGYKNAVLNTAKIIHLQGKSIKNSKNRKKLYFDSQTYYWKKHNGIFPTLIMRILRWPYKLIKNY